MTYHAYNSTLCSDIDRNYTDYYIDEATVKVTVSTTSVSNVGFVLYVYLGESNVISEFRPSDPRLVDLVLFSPVYFKLKFNESDLDGLEFGVLDIWSNDSSADACMTVALRPPEVGFVLFGVDFNDHVCIFVCAFIYFLVSTDTTTDGC